MRFHDSSHSPSREFSLEELVSAINHLRKRRQERDDRLGPTAARHDASDDADPRAADSANDPELRE